MCNRSFNFAIVKVITLNCFAFFFVFGLCLIFIAYFIYCFLLAIGLATVPITTVERAIHKRNQELKD